MSDDSKLNQRQLQVLDSMRTAIKSAPVPVRSCGDCSRCCEGWLSGQAYGHAFSPGTPCFFLEKSCSIYKDRPVDPCRNYRCGWLSEDTFPMWMKPSLSNLIISKRQHQNIDYWIIDQAAATFDQRALNWFTNWATHANANVEYRINGQTNRVGAPEFTNR